MKSTIRRTLCVVVFLFLGLCVHLGGCQKKSVTGDKAGAVEGFVKDSQSLTPIVGADVFLDGAPFPKTDSTGYYRVGRFLGGPTVVKITIKAQGYKTQDKNVILEPNQTQRVDFFLIKEGGS